MELIQSSLYFSGLPIRDLLLKIGYQTSDVDLQIFLGLIWATDTSIISAREQSHLTNSTPIDHQIRFSLKDRVQRGIIRLAEDVKQKLTIQEPLVVSLSADDFISWEFFRRIPQAKITLIDNLVNSESLLTLQELHIIKCLENPNENLEYLLKKSQERIYAGDYRCAYQILSKVSTEVECDEIHYMLGLCTNFFGRTLESEVHFRKMLKSEKPLNVVKASYVVSMLYLRMHPKEKQDLKTAEDLLENAYSLLAKHPEITDHTFHQVFNRNGFALCLYRRGQVEEALEMLEKGIGRLKVDTSGAKNLHQSVLTYNAVQCLRSLKRFEECEIKCQELLALDPLFPEYHLELSRVLLDQSKNSKAIDTLMRAQDLDPLIPETKALLGYAYLQMDLLTKAAISYRHAYLLNPEDSQWALDLGYCLSELGKREELKTLLNAINRGKLSQSQEQAWQALLQDLESDDSEELVLC